MDNATPQDAGRRKFLAGALTGAAAALPLVAMSAARAQEAPPETEDDYARLAAVNTFTRPQEIVSGGERPALSLSRPDSGPLQRWEVEGQKVAQIQGVGLRIFAQDGTHETDWADIRWAPDEFGIYNESTHQEPNGAITNGDIVFYAPSRIRPTLRNPHLSNGHFEIREDYLVPPGPIQSEVIPFRVNHSRPGWGIGVHDYFRIRPDFSRLGDAADGYRVIVVDVKADAPAGVQGPRQLLRLAMAAQDRLVVDSKGNTSASGYLKLAGGAAPPEDAAIAAGEVALWLDPAPQAPKIMFKARDSQGTIRTAQVDLQ
ncbi:MAG: hypothetical protein M3323_09920 [Actinomycetota bacterium]|nr:hypothetical protein [Actinomycetota bacterium]